MDFDRLVVEEDFGPARAGPAGGVRAGDPPGDEFSDPLPHGGDGCVALGAQPLAQLGLVGKLVDPGQLPDQRLVVAPLDLGPARAARAERVEDWCDDPFGTVAVGRAGARGQAGQPADLVPEIELLGQRLSRVGSPAKGDCFWAGRN